MNYGFIIDNRKCIGCHACTVACKAEHDVPIGVNRTWVKYVEKGEFPNTRRLFSVMRCNHCADAPCVEICPVSALYTRADGIVDFDPRRCIGCKACTQACPYDALYIDPDTNTAAKCNYCAHRVDIGLEPACVNVCPEHAIISGDMDNPATEISQLLAREQVTVRKADKGTQPKLFYIEGDEASLNPGATEQSASYMWSSQSTGVGHFARFAEERIAEADPQQMAQALAGATWIGDEETQAVLSPGDGVTLLQKAKDVLRENARRVYDAPDKGVVWGEEVTAYIWTKAISTGAFLVPFLAIITGAAPVRDIMLLMGITLGILFLALTGGLLILDLDKPSRFIYVLLRPQWKSWLVRGGYIIGIYGVLLGVGGFATYSRWAGVMIPALWGCAVFALATAVYTAFLFAQARGRDFWQSPSLSLHMLVHALLAGAAVFVVISLFVDGGPAWRSYLRDMMYAGIVFNLFVIGLELVTPHPTADARRVVRMIVAGPYSRLFWAGAVCLGNLMPLAIVSFAGPGLQLVAGLCVLTGVYITEHIWVRAPQMLSLS